MADSPISVDKQGDISVITIDDDKANVFGLPMTTGLSAALDEVDIHKGAVVIAGRPRFFSAGFDLNVVKGSDPEAGNKMRMGGVNVLLKSFDFPRPIVAACTGHAMAMGAIYLCALDWRIGARGEFKIGLNEVKDGLVLPAFGVEISRYRLDPRLYHQAVLQSRLFTPDEAVTAGFLDEVVEPDQVIDAAIAKAPELARLPNPAFAVTKLRDRGPTKRYVEQNLEKDLASVREDAARFS